MNALHVIAGLAICAAVIWGAYKLNEYSSDKYDYQPFNLYVLSVVACSIILAGIGLFLVPEGHSVVDVFSSAINLNVPEDNINTLTLMALSAITGVGAYINLIIKSNILIATYAVFVQALAVFFILIIIFLIFLYLKQTPGKARR